MRKLPNGQRTTIYARYSAETDQTLIGRQAAADDTDLTGSIPAYARRWSRQLSDIRSGSAIWGLVALPKRVRSSSFSKIRDHSRRCAQRWTTTAAAETAKTYAVYARSATSNSASIARQIEHCTEYARALGATIVAEYVDNGVAGTTNNRPALARLIRDGKQGRFGDLIVEDLERISRTLSGRFGLIDALERQGNSIHSVQGSADVWPVERADPYRGGTSDPEASIEHQVEHYCRQQFNSVDLMGYVDQFREDRNRSAYPMVPVSHRLVRSARTTIRRLSRLISAVLPKRAGK